MSSEPQKISNYRGYTIVSICTSLYCKISIWKNGSIQQEINLNGSNHTNNIKYGRSVIDSWKAV